MKDETLPKRRQWRRTVAGVEGPRVTQVKSALPVYAVDSLAEAEFIQTTLCVHRWDGSFALSRSWNPLDPEVLELDMLDGITEQMAEVHRRWLDRHPQEAASGESEARPAGHEGVAARVSRSNTTRKRRSSQAT